MLEGFGGLEGFRVLQGFRGFWMIFGGFGPFGFGFRVWGLGLLTP